MVVLLEIELAILEPLNLRGFHTPTSKTETTGQSGSNGTAHSSSSASVEVLEKVMVRLTAMEDMAVLLHVSSYPIVITVHMTVVITLVI